MEDKSNICHACLSNDRRLLYLSTIRTLLKEIHLTELLDLKGGVCWECYSIIMRFYRFRLKVWQAQDILSSDIKLKDLKSLSKLSYITKHFYDYQYYYNFDPLISTQTVNKTETKPIKQETDTENIDDFTGQHFDFDSDEKLIHIQNVFVESVKRRKRIKKDSKRYVDKKRSLKVDKHSDEVKKDDITEKFETIIFTEEEMLKNRDEKRNQPNFKKLPYKCDLCVLGFTRKETYNVHMEKKHDKNVGDLSCDVCQIRFPTEVSVQRHRRKHYECYRCTLCKYETVELWSAVNHCRAKHSADTRDNIHCTQCEAVARTPEDLADHMRTKHTLYCNECGEKFKGKNTLRTHITRIHAVKREFVCDICTKTFMTKTRLESHMVTHNATIAQKLAYCTVCDVQYKNIYVYRNHLKNSANHSERSYPCPECNKKFASKVYWTKHYNFYHLHMSQFKCETCNKIFISDWRLKNHKQKHHGLSRSRDHSCNVCGKKFFTLSTLRGHQLTHSEQRSYMCEDCGDTFKQRPALYTHSRLVHKGGKRRK